MNKKYIVRKNEEIQNIVKMSNKIVNKYYIVYYVDNNLSYDRYCISVSKKLGKAHTRNLYKRRIKDIIMKFKYNNSRDYVIILRKSVLDINYENMKKELSLLLKGEN